MRATYDHEALVMEPTNKMKEIFLLDLSPTFDRVTSFFITSIRRSLNAYHSID